ncbi:MAG: HEAT repeat domain-containing protein [Mariprofundales bacterium]
MDIIDHIFPTSVRRSRDARQALAISRRLLKSSMLANDAVVALITTGGDGVEPFRHALQRYGHIHGSRRREEIVDAMRGLQGEAVIPFLAVLIEDDEGMVGTRTVTALIPFGPRINGILFKALKQGNRWTRSHAARALGTMGGARAVPHLIAALQDAEEHVRSEAAEALGKIGDQQATQPLFQSLADPNWLVRESASSALASFDNHQVVDKLMFFLKDHDPVVRSQAIHTLTHIGDDTVLPPLIRALDDPVSSVQWDAADALGGVGRPQAVPPLLRHYQPADKQLRQRIAVACDTIGMGSVGEALQHRDATVRAAAAELLGLQGSMQAIQPLIQVFRDEKAPAVRMWTVIAIGQLASHDAPASVSDSTLQALFAATEDADKTVCYHAKKALEALHDPRAEALVRQRSQSPTAAVAKVQLDCPSCLQPQQILPPLEGRSRRCSHCGLNFTIHAAADGSLLITPVTRTHHHGQQRSPQTWDAVLQVEPDASEASIRAAYRAQLKQCHPDKVAALGEAFKQLAEEKTRQITWALRTAMEKLRQR